MVCEVCICAVCACVMSIWNVSVLCLLLCPFLPAGVGLRPAPRLEVSATVGVCRAEGGAQVAAPPRPREICGSGVSGGSRPSAHAAAAAAAADHRRDLGGKFHNSGLQPLIGIVL